MRMNFVTITRTTAAHTAFTNSVIPIDPPDIPFTVAVTLVDITTRVIVTMKRINVENRCTTKTANVFGLGHLLKLQELAQILAEFMTSTSNAVTSIALIAHTLLETISVTSINIQMFRTKRVQVLAVITPVKEMQVDNMTMYVISTKFTTTARIYRT